MKKALIILFLITTMFLSSCTRKVMWVGTNIGNTFNATYQFYDGKQISTIRLDAGETLSLIYKIEVIKGELILQLLDPNKDPVWQERFVDDASGNFEITTDIGGRYRLNVIGEDTQGSFNLKWEFID